MLKKLYPKNDNEIVARDMGLTVSAVRNAAVKFKIKKAAWYWKQSEIDFINKSAGLLTHKEIADKLHRTRWSVINKIREMAK